MKLLLFGGIAHQHHRTIVHFVCDNVEITIIIEVKNDTRTAAACLKNGHDTTPARGQRVVPVRSGSIQLKRDFLETISGPGLDPANELCIVKALAMFV